MIWLLWPLFEGRAREVTTRFAQISQELLYCGGEEGADYVERVVVVLPDSFDFTS